MASLSRRAQGVAPMPGMRMCSRSSAAGSSRIRRGRRCRRSSRFAPCETAWIICCSVRSSGYRKCRRGFAGPVGVAALFQVEQDTRQPRRLASRHEFLALDVVAMQKKSEGLWHWWPRGLLGIVETIAHRLPHFGIRPCVPAWRQALGSAVFDPGGWSFPTEVETCPEPAEGELLSLFGGAALSALHQTA